MNHSEKLKALIKEFKARLKDEDVAGVIVLHEPGFAEYLYFVDTSYNVSEIRTIETEGKSVQTIGLVNDDMEESKMEKGMADTANMLHHLGTVLGSLAMKVLSMSQSFDLLVNADHSEGIWTEEVPGVVGTEIEDKESAARK